MSRSRRCVVAVPGSSEKMIGKSLEFQVDQVFLDLEDAVAPGMKAQARELIGKTFDSLAKDKSHFKAGIVSIRVNGTGTPWLAEDLNFYRKALVSILMQLYFQKVLLQMK